MKNGEAVSYESTYGTTHTVYAAKAAPHECCSQDMSVNCSFYNKEKGCVRPFHKSCLAYSSDRGDLAQCIFVTKEEFLNLRILGLT